MIGKTILICTDIKSLRKALPGQNACVDSVLILLNTIQAHIISGSQIILGNDLADRAEKQAIESSHTADLLIAFSSALNIIKKVIRDSTIAQDQRREIYTPPTTDIWLMLYRLLRERTKC